MPKSEDQRPIPPSSPNREALRLPIETLISDFTEPVFILSPPSVVHETDQGIVESTVQEPYSPTWIWLFDFDPHSDPSLSDLLQKMEAALKIDASFIQRWNWNALGDDQRERLTQSSGIMVFGQSLAQKILQTPQSLPELRLKALSWNEVSLTVTFHPAYLLKNPSAKKDAWEDLKFALKRIDPRRSP